MQTEWTTPEGYAYDKYIIRALALGRNGGTFSVYERRGRDNYEVLTIVLVDLDATHLQYPVVCSIHIVSPSFGLGDVHLIVRELAHKCEIHIDRIQSIVSTYSQVVTFDGMYPQELKPWK